LHYTVAIDEISSGMHDALIIFSHIVTIFQHLTDDINVGYRTSYHKGWLNCDSLSEWCCQ